MAGSHKSVLQILPNNELEFYGPFTAVQSSAIKLTNPSDDRIAFKVKTTVPKRYCVRPSCGIVEPSESVDVSVMLQPFDCDGVEKNKHKFMIQSMILDFDPDGQLEQIWKEANPSLITDARLKCILRMPDDLLKCEPEELFFEGPVNESSTCMLTARNMTPRDVVFKVKTNAPDRYVVTPNEDIIKGRETMVIKISTVADVESKGESRDRLALLSVLAPDEMPPSLSQLWKVVEKARISERFFSCTFASQYLTRDLTPTITLSQLTLEIERLRKENEDLKSQAIMDRETSSQPVYVAAAPSGVMETVRMNIPPILYLLITFLFALAIGKFML